MRWKGQWSFLQKKKMNQKYKDDIKIVLRDIGKDAAVIITFIAITVSIYGAVCSDSDNLFWALFGPLLAFWEFRFQFSCFLYEFLFAIVFLLPLYLNNRLTNLKTLLITALLIFSNTYLLIFFCHEIRYVITSVALELLFMSIFFVPLYINKPPKSTLFAIGLIIVVCACLFANGTISYELPILNYIPVFLFTIMFIVLSYKNRLVDKSKLIILELLFIQTLDIFFILSLIDEDVPIALLISIGIYKMVVLLFRYRKYKEAKIFSDVVPSAI